MNSVFFVSGIASAVVMLFSPQKPSPHIISPLSRNTVVSVAPSLAPVKNSGQATTSAITAEIIEEKVTPTPTDAPTTTPSPTVSPNPTTTTNSTSPTPQTPNSDADALFALVNNYRQSKGLPAFQKDDRVCAVANTRAPEIAGEMANGTLHSGMYGMNLPYWNTENAVAYGDIQTDFNWWLSDYIHKKAIEGDFTYSCAACSGVYCVEEFTSFTPK